MSGVDMGHLLLLLPFLLSDLLEDEIQQYNTSHGASLINPCHQLISLTIAVLEWYHLYRRSVPGEKQPNSVLVEIFAYIVFFLYYCVIFVKMYVFSQAKLLKTSFDLMLLAKYL